MSAGLLYHVELAFTQWSPCFGQGLLPLSLEKYLELLALAESK